MKMRVGPVAVPVLSAQSTETSFTFREVSALARLRVCTGSACICACKSLRYFRTFFKKKISRRLKA